MDAIRAKCSYLSVMMKCDDRTRNWLDVSPADYKARTEQHDKQVSQAIIEIEKWLQQDKQTVAHPQQLLDMLQESHLQELIQQDLDANKLRGTWFVPNPKKPKKE